VGTAARGVFGGRITIYGESAQPSDPADGINAIRGVGPLLEALERYDEHRSPPDHDLLGAATFTPTHIEGGGALNQVPAECTVGFDRWPIPPETIDEFLEDLESYLEEQLPGEYDFEVWPACPESLDPEAVATDSDATIVQTLAAASGGEIRPFGASSEVSYFADASTVVFGPGVLADEAGPVAHADREDMRRSDVADAAKAIRSTIETVLS
jgi:acetylornithine deacetylase/succinyl-diaminopimelate desuccinylase